MNKLRLLCVGLLLAPLTAQAELPPSAYKELQDKALEQLTIDVTEVSLEPAPKGGPDAQNVTATATVKTVQRTDSDLKPGDTITIRYQYRPLPFGMVGPAPVPILKKDQTVPAWLNLKHTSTAAYYEPAARAYSFQTLPTLPPSPS